MKTSFHPPVLISFNVPLRGKSSGAQRSGTELFQHFSAETTKQKRNDNNNTQIHSKTQLLSILHPSVCVHISIHAPKIFTSPQMLKFPFHRHKTKNTASISLLYKMKTELKNLNSKYPVGNIARA